MFPQGLAVETAYFLCVVQNICQGVTYAGPVGIVGQEKEKKLLVLFHTLVPSPRCRKNTHRKSSNAPPVSRQSAVTKRPQCLTTSVLLLKQLMDLNHVLAIVNDVLAYVLAF